MYTYIHTYKHTYMHNEIVDMSVRLGQGFIGGFAVLLYILVHMITFSFFDLLTFSLPKMIMYLYLIVKKGSGKKTKKERMNERI